MRLGTQELLFALIPLVVMLGLVAIHKGMWKTIIKQGLTLRLQARGPKSFFDKYSGQKQDFCIIMYTISGS